ncbi:MAG: hypothetical protein MJ252_00815 [archaeon]|nr:hypothetical protein [archaeon]
MRDSKYQYDMNIKDNRFNNGFNTTKNFQKGGSNKRGKSYGGGKENKLEIEEESKISNIITQVPRKSPAASGNTSPL